MIGLPILTNYMWGGEKGERKERMEKRKKGEEKAEQVGRKFLVE